MPNFKLTLAYDGTKLQGWQATKCGNAVENFLQATLYQILRENCFLQAASRTDAGVHAEGQIVNFCSARAIDREGLRRSLNALLPPSIIVRAIEEMPESFHPSLDSTGKVYRYRICNSDVQLPHHRFYSWHVPCPLNLEAMREAAHHFMGTHDFSSFCNTPKNTHYKDHLCTLERLEIFEGVAIEVEGSRFLYKMVRNIVGTLVYVGLGKIGVDEIPSIFAARARPVAGITAPAHGLTLKEVLF